MASTGTASAAAATTESSDRILRHCFDALRRQSIRGDETLVLSDFAPLGPVGRALLDQPDGSRGSELPRYDLELTTARAQMSNAQRSSFSKRWFGEARARLQELSVCCSESAVGLQRFMREAIARLEERLRSDQCPHSHKANLEKRIGAYGTQLEALRLKSEELARRAATLESEQT